MAKLTTPDRPRPIDQPRIHHGEQGVALLVAQARIGLTVGLRLAQ